jgi:hypothetical protein
VEVTVDGEQVVLEAPRHARGTRADGHRNARPLCEVDDAVGRAAEHPLAQAAVPRRADHEHAAVVRRLPDEAFGDRRSGDLLDGDERSSPN